MPSSSPVGADGALPTTSGSGTANIALDPIDDLPQGASCLVKVVASAITDIDAVDPPGPPRRRQPRPVLDRQRAGRRDDGAPHRRRRCRPGDDIVIRFTEDVSFSAASFDLSCDGAPQPFLGVGHRHRHRDDRPDGERQPPRRAPSPCSPRVSTTLMRLTTRRTRWPPTISSVSRRSTSRRPSSRRRRSEERRTSPGAPASRSPSASPSRHRPRPSPRVPEGRVDPFSLSGSPGSVIATLDPNGSLPAGAECTVAVTGSGISDADAVDLGRPRRRPHALLHGRQQRGTDGHLPLDHVDRREQRRRRDGRDPVDDRRRRDGHLHLQPRRRHREHGQRASFSIVGSSLRAGIAFDHETKSSYAIRIRTTDSAGAVYEEAVTIAVNDVTEGPTGNTLSGTSVP